MGSFSLSSNGQVMKVGVQSQVKNANIKFLSKERFGSFLPETILSVNSGFH